MKAKQRLQQAIEWARKNPHLLRIIHLTDALVA
jgi:hypothetical protein